ncbi:MAG: hypothetical protein ACJATF_001135, partial [Flavobacteriales bacterium]
PNREVKLLSADGTALWWESKSPPTQHKFGPLHSFATDLFLFKIFCTFDRTFPFIAWLLLL